jgi:RNA polymerase sigma-70 factor (ECF subfamily)
MIYQLLASTEAHDDFAKRIEAEYAHELLSVAMLRVRGRVQPQTWAAFYQTAVEGRRPVDVAGDLNLTLANLFVYRSRVRKMLLDELSQLDPDPDPITGPGPTT